MYRCIYFAIRYAIYYGIPIIVMMPIFFTLPFTVTIVLLNQRIPSKDNALRLNKATRSPQHHDKEVGKRNKRYMQFTRQDQTITVTVFTMVFYQLVLDERFFVRVKSQSKKISLPVYFFIFLFCGRAFASSQMKMQNCDYLQTRQK